MQHRGGPAGFLKVLSPTRIAFADFRGNVQYVSNNSTYGKFQVGMTTYAKLWKGKLTLIRADDANWIESTDNPFDREGLARTGLPVWIIALVGLVPLLSRLHPIVA